MGAQAQWLIPLADALALPESQVGGKAVRLAELQRAGFRVPPGYCLPVACYERFVIENELDLKIAMELGRKPLSSMRWEELWDTALRIRAPFLGGEIPAPVTAAARRLVHELGPRQSLVVRSSAPGEDHGQTSFAGLHESVIGVRGTDALLDALRLVWASLWSDAALLYRTELGLAPAHSRMAVVVQALVEERPSGVGFSQDPRGGVEPNAIIECVPGPCADLVDGAVEPDRWILEPTDGRVLEYRRSRERAASAPLLDDADLAAVWAVIQAAESLLGRPADVEWTGRGARLTCLQLRPITTRPPPTEDPRSWYLSLRPGEKRLKQLAEQVALRRMPELEHVGQRLASQDLACLEDADLAAAIEQRAETLDHWKRIYWDEFIPLAHGVRQLGRYYNDAVRPADPYEFVGLLKGQDMVAMRRNRLNFSLAALIRQHPRIRKTLESVGKDTELEAVESALSAIPEATEFVDGLATQLRPYMDVAYAGERLATRLDVLISMLLQLADAEKPERDPEPGEQDVVARLEQRLLDAVSRERKEEAMHMLEIGRLSWRLRDDDNVLVGRLESQLLRSLQIGAERLYVRGRLQKDPLPGEKDAKTIAQALRRGGSEPLSLAGPAPPAAAVASTAGRPRQLVGQPASPGLASGRVRLVRSTDDLKHFRLGEVLVCLAIEPTMTQLVPLACAIIERRGGMLIHGAIIARELGIPCVNGIDDLLGRLDDGDSVTVDGHLGLVTVGPPDFSLEGVALP